MRAWSRLGCVLWVLLSALPASALSLLVTGPTTGPLAPGEVGIERPGVGEILALQISLDQSVSLQGFDLLLTWDATELDLVAASDQTGLGLDVVPGASGVSERIAAIEFTAVSAMALFELQFEVLAIVPDGADFSIVANGAGLAPASLVLDSPNSAVVEIPEPAPLALLGLAGLLALGAPKGRTNPFRMGSCE